MLKKIQGIIFKITGRKDITMDTDFIMDLKLNSFDIVNIITEFEQQFKIYIPTKDLRNIHNVRDVIEYANTRGIRE